MCEINFCHTYFSHVRGQIGNWVILVFHKCWQHWQMSWKKKKVSHLGLFVVFVLKWIFTVFCCNYSFIIVGAKITYQFRWQQIKVSLLLFMIYNFNICNITSHNFKYKHSHAKPQIHFSYELLFTNKPSCPWTSCLCTTLSTDMTW